MDKATDERVLHRPDEDIAEKPLLKVKTAPAVETADQPAPEAPVAAPAQAGIPAQPAAVEPERLMAKTIVLPRIEPNRAQSPYATHRPAPPDEAAEQAALSAVGGRWPDRQVSAAFLLGLALILVALVSGILIAQLQKKVGSLENRIVRLEQFGSRTAFVPQRGR